MNGIFATRPLAVKAMQCTQDIDVAKADGVHVARAGQWILEDETGLKIICPDDVFKLAFVPELESPIAPPSHDDGGQD